MEKKGILEIFATHPVAMNILMVVILIAGGYVLLNINVQFFPAFNLQFVNVSTEWPGAAAEDVEISVTNRLELDLKNLDHLKNITSTSHLGGSRILLEFEQGADIRVASDDTQAVVDLVISDLPDNAKRPKVSQVRRYELIARIIVTGQSLDQLRVLANQYRDVLLSRGIGKIKIVGLPNEEIAIQIPRQVQRDLGLSLNQFGQQIRSQSRDTSIGLSGRNDAARQLRILDQRRDEIAFEDLPVIADTDGRLITLGDIATIEQRPKSDQVFLSYKNKPAVELQLSRQESGDTLKSAAIVYEWLEETRPLIPPGVELNLYDDKSIALRDRIKVLVNNGIIGLILVLTVLYLFLNTRIAFWVAIGIPVALMGGISLLYVTGGTLNMITLFGFIMTIGIVVDDAIVVGEEAMTRFTENPSPVDAVVKASKRLFLPILAASLTTIFAFVPVMILSGIIGAVLYYIGLVVICVVATSLVEAFLILPGHLRLSFEKIATKSSTINAPLVDRWFLTFRDRWYRNMLSFATDSPGIPISIGFALLILTVGLFGSGRLHYSFFPTPELNLVYTNLSFNAGTPREVVDDYLLSVEEALFETEAELGGNLVTTSLVIHGAKFAVESEAPAVDSANNGAVIAELVQSDTREVRTTKFLHTWRNKLENVPGLETAVTISPNPGPPGRDIEVKFSSAAKHTTKDAALALTEHLHQIPGVYAVEDDTSYGRQQQIFSLTSLGQALGLSVAEISRQLRSSIEGELLQSFTAQYHDIEVNLMLPDEERHQLSELENVNVILSSGDSVPLLDVVEIQSNRGFDVLRHSDGVFSIQVSASVDSSAANTAEILNRLEAEILPKIAKDFGVNWSVGARQADQEQTEQSMKTGALIALALIYLTLAWVFGSYSWPLFVILAIPFGIVGAAWGHLFLGLSFTIITILGLIGLSGIVVNNAIVLVIFYKQNREAGMEVKQAMVEAGCQRLRPVVLSSLTTIVGLLPLLFEKSTQAQFLIPMAVTLIFGLAFSTVLVLFFIPAVLALYERIAARLRKNEEAIALDEQGERI